MEIWLISLISRCVALITKRMTSLVAKFVEEPSRAVFNALTKDQLIQLAAHYSIELPSTRLKSYVKLSVKLALCAKGLINAPDFRPESDEEDEEEPLDVSLEDLVNPSVADEEEGPPSPKPAAMLSFEQQKELLQMQLDNSKVLHQLQFERLRFTEENERARRSLEHQKLELEAQRLDLIRQGKITSPGAAGHKLDIATSLHLLPRFNEKDIDTFFLLFERVADTQDWPGSHRALLLQSRLTGKAQRAFSALTVEEARDYDLVKASVLRAYELIPEAYRQRFRNMRRRSDQTNVEFARELRLQCQRWCVACKVKTHEELIDLIEAIK